MADKAISELEAANSVGTTDLFVLEQSSTAKKLTGQTLMNDLADMLDGHGGIASIVYTPPTPPSLAGSMLITLADETTVTVPVTNGKALTGVTIYYAVSDENETAPVSWTTTPQTMTSILRYLWSYQVYAFNDGSTLDTDPAVIGAYGDTGDQTFVYFKWAAQQPTSDADLSDSPDAWVGICATTASSAPTAYTAYEWYQYKGSTGDTGVSITGVELTSSAGLIDTYTVSFSNGSSTTFQVTNGNGIVSIAKTGTNGLQDTYTVTLSNGDTTTFTVTNGKSIVSIAQTGGSHAAGTTDTYTITYNDGDTSTFTVYNGANGTGAVSSVSGIQADGNGNVPQVISGNGAPTAATVGQVNQLYFDLNAGVLYYCLGESGGTYSWSATTMMVDTALSTTSPNPVTNAAITAKIGTAALNTTAQNLSSAVNEVLADIPTAVSELTNDSGFISADEVIVNPGFADTDTLDTVRKYAYQHPGQFFSWTRYGATTYSPTDDGTAYWQYTLYTRHSTGSNYYTLTAYDLRNSRYFICDNNNNGTWHEIPTDLGSNPITSTSNDTVERWRQLGNGVAWFSQTGCLYGQPQQYGYLINYAGPASSDVFQIWHSQPGGDIYYRGGNGSTAFAASSWKRLARADEIPSIAVTTGSWTPTISRSGGVTTTNATYIKTGHVVHLAATITVTAGTTSSAAYFDQACLPFTPSSSGAVFGTMSNASSHASYALMANPGVNNNVWICGANGGIAGNAISGTFAVHLSYITNS